MRANGEQPEIKRIRFLLASLSVPYIYIYARRQIICHLPHSYKRDISVILIETRAGFLHDPTPTFFVTFVIYSVQLRRRQCVRVFRQRGLDLAEF